MKNKVNKNSRDVIVYGVTDLTKLGFVEKLNNFFIDNSKISISEKIYFFHLLGSMIDSGLTTEQALDLSLDHTDNIRFKRIIATIHYHVSKGKKLSNVISMFGNVFSDLEIGMIKAGEEIGDLATVLMDLSENLEKKLQLERKVKSSMSYPVIVFGFLLVSMWLLMTMVFPILISFFEESEVKLPWITKVLLSVSKFLTHFGGILLIVLVLLGILFSIWIYSAEGKKKFDAFKLDLPIIGPLLRKIYIYNSMHILALLLKSNVPLQKILGIIVKTMGSVNYKNAFQDINNKVQSGVILSLAVKGNAHLFPRLISEIIVVGEKTGKMNEVMGKMVSQFDKEIKYKLDQLTMFFSIFMLLFVALSVAISTFAVLIPIFQLSTSVGVV